MKLFITSDEHGNYQAIKRAEKESGYDENNPNHFRISLGDCFDRDRDNLEIYEYYKRLCDEGKMVVVKGNHNIMLEEYLDGKKVTPFNYIHNGVDETLADFLHETKPFETWCIFRDIQYPTNVDFVKWIKEAREDINEEYPELLPWLRNLPFYYETKNFIFTHASIDVICEDWKQPIKSWEDLTWDNRLFFNKNIFNTDKTVVIGHYGTDELRKMYGLPLGEKPYDILVREDKRVIAIDTCTALTKRVNMLVIEDELLEVTNELEI